MLDSWALMGWLFREEPTTSRVRPLMEAAVAGKLDLCMSMVNVGEVYYLLAKRKGNQEAKSFWEWLQTSPIRIVDAPNSLILEAAQWKSQYPISYADAFAVATAVRERAPLVTGDPDLRPLAGGSALDLEWVGA